MISNQKGMSLIEVLLSVLLISVGVIGLIKLQAYMDKKADYAVNSLKALHAAEAKLEYFRTRSIDGGNGTITFASINDGSDTLNGYDRRWTVTSPALDPALELDGTLKLIEVTASWNNRLGESQSVKLKTMLSKFSEFD